MPKSTSIQKRVTLYYALTMIIISLIISLLLFLSIGRQINVITKDTLMYAVQNAFEDIDYENQIIEIDNDFDSYVKGVTLLVYSEQGHLIKGSVPGDFPGYTPLEVGDYKEVETDTHIWLVYDLIESYDNGQSLWVRGIYAMDDASDTLAAIRRLMVLILPLILLSVIFAGHRITKQAFAPIAKITEGANSIHHGGDLSKRLPQGETKDELYDLTETLNSMIGRLEEAFRSEKEFTSDVSHELKTPLAVTLAECEYMLKEERSPAEYQESLETIENQTRRTMSMIQQLLQISRTMDKSQQLEKETFDFSILAEGIVEELSYMAADQGVEVFGEIESDINVTADETLVVRVIMNLMTNAMKYRRDIPNAWVKLQVRQTDEYVEIIVSDNGIGIADENLDRIFKKFFKVDKTRSRSGESFGLGLAMVKWIVEAHDGKILVESKLGEGSRFTVLFPNEQGTA